MDRLVRNITGHYLNKLDDAREFFLPEDLTTAGFPDFLVRRIRLELIRNLQDSVKPPHSDWANMDTDAVRQAWQHFLDAIHEEIRLPASYVKPVLESAIGDILELMVSPRAFLPDYIYGSDSVLDLKTFRKRCEWIVIYPYFASAIPRYMEKRGKETLTKEQAVRIIRRLDELVTEHYTSLNWAQLFDPWYQIMGERVDPALFAGFFRDKGIPGVARHFEAEHEAINRTRLIEILSMPQIEEEPDAVRYAERGQKSAPESSYAKSEDYAASHDRTTEEEIGAAKSQKKDQRDLKTAFTDSVKAGESRKSASPSESHSGSIQKSEDVPKGEENLLARFRKVNGDLDEDVPLHSRLQSSSSDKPDDDGDQRSLYSRLTPPQDDASKSEATPIWQKFSSGWQDDAGYQGKEKRDRGTGGKQLRNMDTDKLDKIRKHVRDMESEFIEEIFGGDENAFLEALEQIARFDTWKAAGNYINKEVFNRNIIDIYSDTAIYFTDRMQTYFLERE